ncbi:unnamed protein product [Rotaria sp. Silwood1]|nr:unnamed protein product [Rotaria sp. Silwood1]CAF4852023.1 unnamed protein product [Rotaria sp. Silwood1]
MLGFSEDEIACFIAFIRILSCIAQTLLLACLQKYFGAKETIMVGLFFQIVQLAAFGIATSNWIMWVSVCAKDNQQGLVQGMVNDVHGLCNGLGPALFGFTFYLLNSINVKPMYSSMLSRDIPGPPSLFGALLATIGLMFSLLLPKSKSDLNEMGNESRNIEENARLLRVNHESDDNNIQTD